MTDRIALSRTRIVASLAGLAAVAAVAASPQLLGSRVGAAVDGLGGAAPGYLWAAVAAFALSLLCSASAWRAAVGSLGGSITRADATARFSAGALVNSLAPAHLGDAVRIALFARAIEGPDRGWAAGGVYAAVGAARALVLAALIVGASASGAMPLWPVFVLCGAVAAFAGLAYLERNDRRHRFAHLFDAVAALVRNPRAGAVVLGWELAAGAAKIAAAGAVAAALAVPHPLPAALVIVAALELANALPLTPGNLGVASGAIAVALQSRGIGMTEALSAGIALHALETIVGLSAGTAGALWVWRPATRWAFRLGAAGASLGLAALFGVTVFDLV